MKTTVQHVRDPARSYPLPKLTAGQWVRLEKNVRSLHRRIARADQNGERRKAKSLRRLLAKSFGAKALATREPVGT